MQENLDYKQWIEGDEIPLPSYQTLVDQQYELGFEDGYEIGFEDGYETGFDKGHDRGLFDAEMEL